MLDHYSNILDQLGNILNRISDRAGKDKDKGMDITTVTNAVNNSTVAIKTARDAIVVQTGKTYPITVTTEDKLKTDVGAARKLLHDDLVKVRNLVIAVRDAVHSATSALAQLHKIVLPSVSVSLSVSPSVSVTPTPTPSN